MAQVDSNFTVTIIGESGIVHYGSCSALFVPAEKETIVILAYHTPMIMKLGNGIVAIKNGRQKQELTTITSGLVYVGDNEATVLINL